MPQIADGDIFASINHATGVVSFRDSPEEVGRRGHRGIRGGGSAPCTALAVRGVEPGDAMWRATDTVCPGSGRQIDSNAAVETLKERVESAAALYGKVKDWDDELRINPIYVQKVCAPTPPRIAAHR